ncbi:hypothetical protein GCM10027612_82390 [Microbispora bryophytorum subsp. camponoti]
MRGYAKLIREHAPNGPVPVRVVATSATRDAANRADFVSGVRDVFGVEPEVVTGDEEARLSFTGATRGLARAGAEAETPIWWWTSGAVRPSSSSVPGRSRARCRWTSAAYG